MTPTQPKIFHGPVHYFNFRLEVVVEPWLEGLWPALEQAFASNSETDTPTTSVDTDKTPNITSHADKKLTGDTLKTSNEIPASKEETVAMAMSQSTSGAPDVVAIATTEKQSAPILVSLEKHGLEEMIDAANVRPSIG